MDQVPNEIIDAVSEYLHPGSLFAMLLCCKNWYGIALPRLYCILDIRLGSQGLDRKTQGMITAFRKNRSYLHFLRDIRVASQSTGDSLNKPILEMTFQFLMGTLFHSSTQSEVKYFSWEIRAPVKIDNILTQLPRNLRKLHLESSIIDRTVCFPNLQDLTCKGIRSSQDMQWVKQHVMQAKLQKLRLATYSHQALNDSKSLFVSGTALASMTSLILERVDVSQSSFANMCSLNKLSLRYCRHVSEALESILHGCNKDLELRDLSIDTLDEPLDLGGFLRSLSRKPTLQALRIHAIGVQEPIPLSWILPLKNSVSKLEWESQVTNPDGLRVHRYPVIDVSQLLIQCFQLQHLSIAVDISNTEWKKWVDVRTSDPRCNLRHLHQRCHRSLSSMGRLKEAMIDARRLASPWIRSGRSPIRVSVGTKREFAWTIYSQDTWRREPTIWAGYDQAQ